MEKKLELKTVDTLDLAEIKSTIDKGNELYIDCNVNICYGQNVVDVSNAAQEAVAAAVESIAGVKVARVNVNVCGIIRP